jgi:hypothetical protein
VVTCQGLVATVKIFIVAEQMQMEGIKPSNSKSFLVWYRTWGNAQYGLRGDPGKTFGNGIEPDSGEGQSW